jgi:hypothetical protein
VHRSDLAAAAGDEFASDNETIGADEPGTLDTTSLHYDGSQFSYVRGGKTYRQPLR